VTETPFDSVEGAHEYVGLLLEALREARSEVEQDLASAREDGAKRRVEALQIVSWKLERLDTHLTSSRHLLNDLRRLRDLLVAERPTRERPARAEELRTADAELRTVDEDAWEA
jgi:hypothetical protein